MFTVNNLILYYLCVPHMLPKRFSIGEKMEVDIKIDNAALIFMLSFWITFKYPPPLMRRRRALNYVMRNKKTLPAEPQGVYEGVRESNPLM